MTAPTVMRDERTVAIENASYRVAYLVLSYGLLVIAAYRGFVQQEGAWDLLGLVVLGGAVATLYQGRSGILSRRWAFLTVAAAVIAAIIAAVMLVLIK